VAVAVGVGGTGVAVGVSVASDVGTGELTATVGVLLGIACSAGCGPTKSPHPVNKRTNTANASILRFIY
jgi:hypothetical protein